MRLYKYRLVALSLIGTALLLPGVASATMMTEQNTTTTSSSADEQKGQAVYAQYQTKAVKVFTSTQLTVTITPGSALKNT